LVRSISKFQKSEKCKKEQKFWKFHILDSRISIFNEKNPKSGRRGGAEFGTHGFKIFQNLFALKKLICH
jgi:hypothetical protein